MQIAGGIGQGEQRFEIQMQRAVAQRRKVDQSGVAMGRLQREGKIHGYSGCAAAAFGIDHGEHLAARTFLLNLALRRRQAHEGFEKIGGGGGALDEFASPGAHRIHDDLRLVETADGEHGRVGQFLAQKFDGAQSRGGIIGGNVDQENVRAGGLNAAGNRIGSRERKTGASMHRAGYAGAIHQHLQHGALLVIRGHDDD